MNEQVLFAYFDETGELLGASCNILSNHLPINLQIKLKKELSEGWISELFEFANDNETDYFVTIENADQKVQLKSAGHNAWSVYKKSSKI